MKIVALLDSMWGWGGYNDAGEEAPRYFRINPDNFSGRRLYRICGDGHSLLVTNSCRTVQASASHHGVPDPAWVKSNLEFLAGQGMELLLVCGAVARRTFEESGFTFPRVIQMDHPAARRWSNAKLDAVSNQISQLALYTNGAIVAQ